MQYVKKIKNIYKDYLINEQLKNHNYIEAAQRARKWIYRNTIQGNGIVITSKQRTIYQEVTGYYIPTLLQWGMRELAIDYANYLCEIQEDSGAWLNYSQQRESIFNTGQVLRGLLAINDILPDVQSHIIKGCEWLVSYIDDNGRLKATEGTVWADNNINSELIHLYCLPPLKEAGKKLNEKRYLDAVSRCLQFYLKNYRNDIDDFNYLSHFYAYVLEALLDLGEKTIVKNAMRRLQKIQRFNGAVPAYKNCTWVCSTGLFQLAMIWYKLGDWSRGNKAFDYAVSLQNQSGGWYGGYRSRVGVSRNLKLYMLNEKITYFPDEEISWAVKYFFDALYYRQRLEFEMKAHTFLDNIHNDDIKFNVVFDIINQLTRSSAKPLNILDVGCGKGRYIKKLLLKLPDNNYYGMDISCKVMNYIGNKRIKTKKGSILNINYDDNTFDVVLSTESLEHAIFIDLGIKEMTRVLKTGGTLIIIDKDERSFENVKYSDWIDPKELSTKQWLNVKDVTDQFMELGLINMQTFFLPTTEGNMYRAFIGRKAE